MVDYFKFFGIKPSIKIDDAKLKAIFYENTKKFHPDLHGNSSDDSQNDFLQKSVLNNKAYKIISNFNSRVNHLLEVNEMSEEDQKYQLPQQFLMEMMDMNDEIESLEMNFSKENQLNLVKNINSLLMNVDIETIDNDLIGSENQKEIKNKLEKIRELYFKKKYLLRIQDSLNKFATR